jgi:hypothetical protein
MCFRLNQYHHETLGRPFWDCVGWLVKIYETNFPCIISYLCDYMFGYPTIIYKFKMLLLMKIIYFLNFALIILCLYFHIYVGVKSIIAFT